MEGVKGEFYTKSHSSYPEALSSLQVTNCFGFAVGISKYSNENCKVEMHFVKKKFMEPCQPRMQKFLQQRKPQKRKETKPPKAPEVILFEFGKISLKISMCKICRGNSVGSVTLSVSFRSHTFHFLFSLIATQYHVRKLTLSSK